MAPPPYTSTSVWNRKEQYLLLFEVNIQVDLLGIPVLCLNPFEEYREGMARKPTIWFLFPFRLETWENHTSQVLRLNTLWFEGGYLCLYPWAHRSSIIVEVTRDCAICLCAQSIYSLRRKLPSQTIPWGRLDSRVSVSSASSSVRLLVGEAIGLTCKPENSIHF